MELGEHYTPDRIGLLTLEQQQQALDVGFAKTETPVVSLTMLGAKGLIGRYGQIYYREEIETLGI